MCPEDTEEHVRQLGGSMLSDFSENATESILQAECQTLFAEQDTTASQLSIDTAAHQPLICRTRIVRQSRMTES